MYEMQDAVENGKNFDEHGKRKLETLTDEEKIMHNLVVLKYMSPNGSIDMKDVKILNDMGVCHYAYIATDKLTKEVNEEYSIKAAEIYLDNFTEEYLGFLFDGMRPENLKGNNLERFLELVKKFRMDEKSIDELDAAFARDCCIIGTTTIEGKEDIDISISNTKGLLRRYRYFYKDDESVKIQRAKNIDNLETVDKISDAWHCEIVRQRVDLEQDAGNAGNARLTATVAENKAKNESELNK